VIEDAKKEKHRAEIFDALGHPTRIMILKSLSEGPLGFADLKKMLQIDSSGHLKHHLDKLDALIETDEHGKYRLSDEGKEALLTMQPIEKYDEDARFREQVGMLLRALRSPYPAVQDVTVVQLSLFGSKAISYLTSALSHAFEEPKESPKRDSVYDYDIDSKEGPERAITGIVKTLGIISAPSTIPDIMKALPQPEAFEALAKIANKQALDAIISSMPKWYNEYVDTSHYSTDRWKDSDAEDFPRKIFGYFGEEGRKGLEVALREGNDAIKNATTRILALVGDSHSFPALIDALENGSLSTKTRAAEALHRLKATEAVPTMVSEFFKDQGREVSIALAKTILDLGSINDWVTIWFHHDSNMWKGPFRSVIINSGEKAVNELTKLLQDPDPKIQMDAADIIARIKRGEKSEVSFYY
jgi:HEAT repeat protein